MTGYTVEPIEVVTRVETHTELLLAARTAHVRRDWHASYEAFVRASEAVPLNTDDLDALAVAAWRLGRGKESVRAAERVFTQLARTDPSSAAMKAVELSLAWINRGDLNIGQGWIGRAHRLLDAAPESPTHGYLAYLDATVAVFSEDPEELANRVTALRGICGRVDVPAVTALCRVAEALAAILDARMTEGFALLDEALLPELARLRSPVATLTKPKDIARNSNPALRSLGRPVSAHGRRIPGAILAQQGRHTESLDALQAALREYRTQRSRYETAQVYEWMAVAHKALGDDELAAADSATA